MPSRAVHAEANAVAQAAKHGIATSGASIYVTLEPCLSCLKLIISAGIDEVFTKLPSTVEKSSGEIPLSRRD
jgi:dCMP deaminase